MPLAVGAVEPGAGEHRRAAVTGAGDEEHVEVALDDRAVCMSLQEGQARRSAPMAQKPGLDVFRLQRPFEKRIVEKVDLAHGQIVRGAPPRVDGGEIDAHMLSSSS